jgi:hypothetical protein
MARQEEVAQSTAAGAEETASAAMVMLQQVKALDQSVDVLNGLMGTRAEAGDDSQSGTDPAVPSFRDAGPALRRPTTRKRRPSQPAAF